MRGCPRRQPWSETLSDFDYAWHLTYMRGWGMPRVVFKSDCWGREGAVNVCYNLNIIESGESVFKAVLNEWNTVHDGGLSTVGLLG